jgi:hypothetical protein
MERRQFLGAAAAAATLSAPVQATPHTPEEPPHVEVVSARIGEAVFDAHIALVQPDPDPEEALEGIEDAAAELRDEFDL